MAYPALKVEINFDKGAYEAASTGWTDVTAYVEDLSFQYGKSTYFDEFQPGSGQAILVNDTGRFDPTNASGTHYGKLLPRRRIRVSTGSPATYLAYGFIDGWPTEQQFRKVGRCRIQWHDALSILETAPLPNSVWAYHVKSTDPWMWLPLDEEDTTVALDASGHRTHGAYRVAEDLTVDMELPKSIIKEGTVDAIVPSSDRRAKNWAKVQAEVGQPPTVAWAYDLRSPTIVGDQSLSAAMVDRVFTVEAWVRCRTAFPLDVGNPAPTTPIRQPVLSFGGELASAWFEVGLAGGGQLYAGAKNPGWAELTFATNMMDGQPHHVAWASFVSGGNWLVSAYVDGVLDGTVNLGTPPVPSFSWTPLFFRAKPWTSTWADSRSFQSAVSDLIFYDATRTAGAIQDSYEAGFYGSLAGAELTSGEAVNQTLGMIGWLGDKLVQQGQKVVDPGVLKGRTALQLLRDFASSEQAPLFQSPDGRLQLGRRYWSLETRSRVSQYTLSDAAGATLGYEELDYAYDDSSIVNHCTVTWTGGEEVIEDATSIAAYGLLDRSITTKLGSAEDARAMAEWIVAAYRNPRRRVDRPLRFSPITDDDFTFIFDCEFGLRITLVRTTPDARTVTEDYWVMAVSHNIAAGQGPWQVDITLEKADDPFRIFAADISVADGPDVAGY